MWRDGAFLVVRKGEVFPDRCVKSNRPAHGRRVLQAAEGGWWLVFLVHLWNPVAAEVIAPFITKAVTFTLGLSDEWCRRRRRAFYVAGAVIVGSLVAMAYGITLIGRRNIGICNATRELDRLPALPMSRAFGQADAVLAVLAGTTTPALLCAPQEIDIVCHWPCPCRRPA